jgi:hypothetical protein
MAWIQPELAWTAEDIPSPSDFNRIEGNEDYLKTALDAEIVNRGLAVTAEGVARAAADSTLQTNINTEAGTRASQDAAYYAVVHQEVADETWTRIFNDNSLQAGINSEAGLRTSGDSALGTRIDNILPYTGNDKDYESFPIGTILMVLVATFKNRNAGLTIYLSGDRYYADTGSVSISGTWVSRGMYYNSTQLACLAQRIG